MVFQDGKSSNIRNFDKFAANKHPTRKEDYMPPEARRELVLDFLIKHNIPLPPLAIWGGLNQHYRVTFSYRTMQNILSDLWENGDVMKVDTEALRDDGEIVELQDPSKRRSYYFPTDTGRDRIYDANDE